ncbi:MAG: Gfo/Idh/MocA family oxidoreductase [Bryobacteraceae bacterium]|nr:Gfo/Idh/MocA family oxidoreductase [Bryobacterales bacterium]MEB2363181.1 Gfo/Idh/MocA family oxidoreductase [Bryobacterales bacterium]NUN01517.1 Gfo/Idh/MocA family oxidoreductase [Bryobacteraceae bacterium]
MSSTRRCFLGAMTAASCQRVMGANDRVRVGFIGYGLIGAQHVFDFKNQKDCDPAAMCDVYQPRMEQGIAACGGAAKGYRDFRKLLDDTSLDAVVISTPDHWHAPMAILACAAGKDVYVEKPLTLFIREGRWLVTAARRYNRVVQVGTQQRSGLHYQEALGLLRSGVIGRIHSVRMASFRNVMPGFGRPAGGAPPNDLDYDLWLGPAPHRPYSPHRALYHFRWFWDYSGGQMTNLGAHQVDILQWVLELNGPTAVSSAGGRFALEDDGETPDTQDAIFEYPGLTAVWSHREASAGNGVPALEFCGTKGSMIVLRSGFEVFADVKRNPEDAIPVFQGTPAGGPKRGTPANAYWTTPMKKPGSSAQQLDLHVRNFLDCVKSRQKPIADVEEGHRTATTCHLANISLRTGRKIRWDPIREQITGDGDASAMLERPYREPWAGIIGSLRL